MDNNIQKTYDELSHPAMGGKQVKEKTLEDGIVDLESQKIALEDRLDNLSYFKGWDKKNDITIQEVEKKLNEIKDIIKKLKEKK